MIGPGRLNLWLTLLLWRASRRRSSGFACTAAALRHHSRADALLRRAKALVRLAKRTGP